MSRQKTHTDFQETEVRFPILQKPSFFLFLITLCCVVSMGYYYIRKENITSVTQVLAGVTAPVQKGINRVGGFFSEVDKERLALEEANERIAQLESQLDEMNQTMISYDSRINDYQYMQRLLELKTEYTDYETTGASVVFTDTGDNWYSSFTIDKGLADGLKEGMNVVADGGLAGYLSEVTEHYSVVTTIINDNINVSGEQMSTGDACMVMGDLLMAKRDGLLPLRYMDAGFDISEDQVIMTSRISDLYLPGILIGYATHIEEDENALTASGYLKPAVDFRHIRHVLVILTTKETRD